MFNLVIYYTQTISRAVR